MWNPFSWIANLFRSPRMKKALALVDEAVPVVEAVFQIDWDGNGIVATSRAVTEISETIATLSPLLRSTVFAEYVTSDGRINTARLGASSPAVLKQLLAMSRLVPALARSGETGLSFSLLQTALQLAYERART